MNENNNNTHINNDKTFRKQAINYTVSGGLLVIKRVFKTTEFSRDTGAKRSVITGFSDASRRRMAKFLRESRSEYKYMVTLTYPECETDGITVKEHLHRFLQEFRRRIEADSRFRGDDRYANLSVFWFLEFQNRGAPHFHLFTTSLPDNYIKWVSKTWFDIVDSDNPYHLSCGTRCEKLRNNNAGVASYAQKYAAKSEQKKVPEAYQNVGRFWGVTGLKITMAAHTCVTRDDSRDKAVLRIQEQIKLKLDTLKQNKIVVMLADNEKVRVAVLHDENIRSEFAHLIARLNAANYDTNDRLSLWQHAEISSGEK